MDISSQIELDDAIKSGEKNFRLILPGKYSVNSDVHISVEIAGEFYVEAWDSSQPHVVARDSSQPHVVAWGSSQPHVVAWGSSQPHVVARDSSQPHVEAWESSQPHVVARDSSQPHVEAWDSSQPHVEAWDSSQPHVVAWGFVHMAVRGKMKIQMSPKCHALIHGAGPIVTGGSVTNVVIENAADWCEYYGVGTKDGIAVLFKAVGAKLQSGHDSSFVYEVGKIAESTRWDDGKEECGVGLHFCPSPAMAKQFNASATRYLACPVEVSTLVFFPNGSYPQKVKARKMAAPCWECDIRGHRLEGTK